MWEKCVGRDSFTFSQFLCVERHECNCDGILVFRLDVSSVAIIYSFHTNITTIVYSLIDAKINDLTTVKKNLSVMRTTQQKRSIIIYAKNGLKLKRNSYSKNTNSRSGSTEH